MNRLENAPGLASDELGYRQERLTHVVERHPGDNDLVMKNLGIVAVDERLGRELRVGSLSTGDILASVGITPRESIPIAVARVKL